jgi:ABC-type nitrate/sulfonate/bicarbonate transport system substrate-binding protein
MANTLTIAPACYHVLHVIPIRVADEMNFFIDEGLRDEEGNPAYDIVTGGLAPFTFEIETLGQAMKERGIDVAMDVHPSTVAYQSRRGQELFIVAGWRNQQANHLVAVKPISSLAQLKGKRVGVIDFKDNLALILAPWLRKAGLDPFNDVEWVRDVHPAESPAALRAGKVDAIFCNPLDVPSLVREGFNDVWDIAANYPQGRPDRVIVATGRALREKREQVRACLKAMLRAYWFMRAVENHRYILELERRLRRQSKDPDERRRKPLLFSAERLEYLPFPYDGLATGLANYLQESVELELVDKKDMQHLESVDRQDLVKEAFEELASRSELRGDLQRAKEVQSRLGF